VTTNLNHDPNPNSIPTSSAIKPKPYTHAYTQTQTTLRATSVATGGIYALGEGDAD